MGISLVCNTHRQLMYKERKIPKIVHVTTEQGV